VLGPLVTKRGNVKLSILRNARSMVLTVPLTHACGFGIELGNTDGVAAYSDGRRLLVTRGMMNFAASDQELAYVLAREMAHNALGHPQKQRMTAAAGGMIDNMIRMHPDPSSLGGTGGILPMPAALDTAADMLALYMVARGGYDIAQADEFWKKLAQRYPPGVANGYTALHPATPARLAMIEKTAATIRQKQAAKRPLTP
jgi:predicted Zn-dependent protease